jgi:hypothetical protein
MFEYKTTGQDTGNVRGHLMLHHENFGWKNLDWNLTFFEFDKRLKVPTPVV